MSTTYDIIVNEPELRKFIDWLPDLDRGEVYYIGLLARRKYCREENLGAMKAESEIRRLVATKENLFSKISELECRRGAYNVPEESLAVYITPNPRSQEKALHALLIRTAEAVSRNHRVENVVSLAMSELHKARGKRRFVSFDFDGPLPYDLGTCVNIDAVDVVKTRGGWHVLVRPADVVPELRDSWWRSISQLPGRDSRAGDDMLPVPGCCQGEGFTPHLLSMNEVLEKVTLW